MRIEFTPIIALLDIQKVPVVLVLQRKACLCHSGYWFDYNIQIHFTQKFASLEDQKVPVV